MQKAICSVVMSVRDERASYLTAALSSLLAQTVRDFEVVLVDDGSSQLECISALESFARRDSRVRLFHQPPRGLATALNYGVAQSRSGIIVRHDSDDWSSPERLDFLLGELNHRPNIVLLGSAWAAYTARGRLLWKVSAPQGYETIRRLFEVQNPFCHGSVVFSRMAFEQVGGYREAFVRSQDYDLFWRLAEIGPVDNLSSVLYHRRFASDSVSRIDALGQLVSTRAARILASARSTGRPENVLSAFEEARATVTVLDSLDCTLRQFDALLLSGNVYSALAGYAGASVRRRSGRAVAKLLRGLLFGIFPSSGRFLFSRLGTTPRM